MDQCILCGEKVNLLWTNQGWVCGPCFRGQNPGCLSPAAVERARRAEGDRREYDKQKAPDYSDTGNENASQW